MKLRVFLDPGHGGKDPGSLNGPRLEKNDNLRLSKAVQKKLEGRGHTVMLSRDRDTYLSYEDRMNKAKTFKADIFISVHRNSFTKPTACGLEVWVRYQQHISAAATLLEHLAKVPHQVNRGVKTGNYKVLYDATMPAMLLELGFISNAKDNELYDKHFDDNATEIAKSILAYFGEPWDNSKPPTSDDIKYKVQVGAFSVKSNAESFLKDVRAKGLDAFLVSINENQDVE